MEQIIRLLTGTTTEASKPADVPPPAEVTSGPIKVKEMDTIPALTEAEQDQVNAEEDEDLTGEPEQKVTFADLKAEVVALSQKGKKDDIKNMLQKKFKVKTLPELTEQQYKPLMDELKSMAG
jgi:phage I-like protein